MSRGLCGLNGLLSQSELALPQSMLIRPGMRSTETLWIQWLPRAASMEANLPFRSFKVGGNMKKRLIIFVAMNVWGLSGCAPSRSNDIGVFEPRTALDQGAALEQKRSATAARHSAATDKAA